MKIRVLYYNWPWSLAGTQVRCSQALGMQLESSKAVTGDFRRNQCGRCQIILHFPTPDYSKIPSKVDTWRSTRKVCFRNKTVSDGVTCSEFQF
jgi:hypothetical protein